MHTYSWYSGLNHEWRYRDFSGGGFQHVPLVSLSGGSNYPNNQGLKLMSLNMNPNNTIDLAGLLKSFTPPIYYIPNPGNAGDSLIACATFQFFEKHAIPYVIHIDKCADLSGKTVCYSGGGNFGGEQSRGAQFAREFAYSCGNFILLPHTLFGAEELLGNLPDTTHIICREKVSYAHAIKHCLKASVHLHDDMVINVDVDALLAPNIKESLTRDVCSEILRRLQGKSNYDFGISLRSLMNYLLFKSKSLVKPIAPIDPAVLNAFRTDVEKTHVKIPEDNVDISALYELSSCDRKLAELSTYRLLNHINAFDEVATNRLHVAIAAMKLGKRVKLYGNNYFKIRAIYEFSIENRFDNVIWMK